MTTNDERHAIYRYEFFRASDAEDSDPDTAFEITADNTDDCETAIATFLNLPNDDDIRFVWIERDADADRYNVLSIDENESVGVAYVTVEYVKE
jgi:hypothetical protein